MLELSHPASRLFLLLFFILCMRILISPFCGKEGMHKTTQEGSACGGLMSSCDESDDSRIANRSRAVLYGAGRGMVVSFIARNIS